MMIRVRHKDTATLLRKVARTPGWSVGHSGHHIRVTTPTGFKITTSGSGGEGRGYLNFRAMLKRHGFPL